jgi:hypothetical protein
MQLGWIYYIYPLDYLYLELTNYQRIIEAQRVKIAELESQIPQAPAFGAAKVSEKK